jgi:hypothetical protein
MSKELRMLTLIVSRCLEPCPIINFFMRVYQIIGVL